LDEKDGKGEGLKDEGRRERGGIYGEKERAASPHSSFKSA